MPLSKEQKKQIVEDLKDKFQRQKSVVFVDYKGITVKDVSLLRNELKKGGIDFKVAKKTLIDLAIKDIGIKDVPIKDLDGQLALSFGYADESESVKQIYKFSKINKSLKLLGGILTNAFVDSKDIISFAKLPSRKELLAQFVGTINAPIGSFTRVLNGNIMGLINVLNKIKK